MGVHNFPYNSMKKICGIYLTCNSGEPTNANQCMDHFSLAGYYIVHA